MKPAASRRIEARRVPLELRPDESLHIIRHVRGSHDQAPGNERALTGRRGHSSVDPAKLRTMRIDRLDQQEPFITADGSSIRELAGIPSGNASQQSLAEATVPAGGETVEHYHSVAEEIYHFVAGVGRLRLGSEEADVAAGDTIVIAPGLRHKLWNPGVEPLVLLCCCAPPYSHDDTVLCE